MDANKSLIHRFYEEVWNKGNLEVSDEVFDSAYVRNDAGGPAPAGGPEGQKKIAAAFRSAFPDGHMTIDFVMAENDMVAARWTIEGTQKGKWAGAEPSGKHVKFSGINIFRFKNGKVVELWNHRDDLSLMRQIGAIQIPTQPQQKK